MQRLPLHQEWDYAIDLKPKAPQAQPAKTYPLAPGQQEALNEFLL